MATETLTEERFRADVSEHTMIIIRDEPDAYRHIRFKRPETGCMHFDLITWPGYLCYCGDMGTYVFSRLRDMFEFFRSGRRADGTLRINPSYWAEKLQAVDGNRLEASAQEFDFEAFKRIINTYRVRWMRDLWEDYRENPIAGKALRRELWQAVQADVLDGEEDEHRCMQRAYDFRHPRVGCGRRDHYEFEDLWEHNFKRYTFRFMWCCYALAWGIEQYDKFIEPVKCEACNGTGNDPGGLPVCRCCNGAGNIKKGLLK